MPIAGSEECSGKSCGMVVIVNKEFVNFISFTQWMKKFLNFKPQGVASFTASAAL
jgi:hypothetical protein